MACRLLVAGLSSSTRSAFCREASLLARRPASQLHQVPLQASIRSTALGLDGQKQLFGTQAAGALSCPGPRGCGAEQARKLFGTVVGGGALGLLRARGALTMLRRPSASSESSPPESSSTVPGVVPTSRSSSCIRASAGSSSARVRIIYNPSASILPERVLGAARLA